MSNRKPTTRRRTAKKSAGGSVWPWVLMLAVVAGGIQAYEHRDSLLPQRQAAKATAAATSSQKTTVAAKRETTAPERAAAVRPASPVSPVNGPVPPRSIAMPPPAQQSQVAGILPETRPPVEKVSLGEKSGAFAFCGRSGLNNCVSDGNTFWMKGVKMQLAGIEVPQIDRARCMEERQRGFIAKVRLRDMLNAGAFDVASSAPVGGKTMERKRISRSGVSFADQLVREGLAHPVSAKNPSWCG